MPDHIGYREADMNNQAASAGQPPPEPHTCTQNSVGQPVAERQRQIIEVDEEDSDVGPVDHSDCSALSATGLVAPLDAAVDEAPSNIHNLWAPSRGIGLFTGP